MPLDLNKARKCLRAFDFSGLFTQELGWDWYTAETKITVAKSDLFLKGVAEKRGVHVFHCPPGADGRIPDAALCAAIERQVARIAREHLLIFTDAARTEQVWLYPRREPGKPIRLIRYRFEPGKANELLLQKLSAITFTLNEEEGLNLLGVVECLKDALDRDVVTKSFYQQFDRERLAFQKFLKGIPDEKLQRWYVAVLLNRLMFIYFIQQKGFLGGHDQRYLQNKLVACKGNYYRDFLCPLFFQGFALRPEDRPATINAMLGQVPYLNGGIFQRHQIEEAHGRTIEIANEAFRAMFAFFDRWRWHLDERPLAGGNEIDPSILGYIFERYINAIQPGEQKAKGAYYTKEDITGYIARNTIIPRLFDMAAEKCRTAFEGDASVWHLLALDPDRYIYAAVGHGVALPLPPEIEEGVDTKRSNLLERRAGWNKPAPSEYALPTEIWREVVARRQRYAEVHSTLDTRNSTLSVNSLITFNLDIVQFAQDVVENAEPDLLWTFYGALKTITVLDPTCGSGAFLFAAVNILEPLYSACLSRMETFLGDWERTGTRHTQYRKWFRKELDTIRAHLPAATPACACPCLPAGTAHADRPAAQAGRNQNYFIFKTIILNNLYGVDIMDEAVEICKLRLFLKLAAQIEPDYTQDNLVIEPLPDIDFNIRAGNTLVGFATEKQAEDVLRQDVLAYNTVWPEVQRDAADIAGLFYRFRQQQTEIGGAVSAEDKADLRTKLAPLEDRLNAYLAETYGVTAKKAIKDWVHSHKPFHWFIEFYEIMARGGFNVIIGNPPYVEYDAALRRNYQVKGYSTLECGNLHAFIVERCLGIATKTGCLGFIVPLPSISTSRMKTLQAVVKPSLEKQGRHLWISAFDERPSNLFTGVDQRLIVEIFGPQRQHPLLTTTGINRWASRTRETLFPCLSYATQEAATRLRTPTILKIKCASLENKLLESFYRNEPIQRHRTERPTKHILAYRTAGGRYWKVVLDKPFGSQALSEKAVFLDGLTGPQAVACISSSTFWWYYSSHFDMYNLKDYMIFGFRFSHATETTFKELDRLGRVFVKSLEANAEFQHIQTKTRGSVDQKLYVASRSKPIIDEIDRVLAKHYGFTEEELDFIINYDIKYRMGLSGEEESDE